MNEHHSRVLLIPKRLLLLKLPLLAKPLSETSKELRQVTKHHFLELIVPLNSLPLLNLLGTPMEIWIVCLINLKFPNLQLRMLSFLLELLHSEIPLEIWTVQFIDLRFLNLQPRMLSFSLNLLHLKTFLAVHKLPYFHQNFCHHCQNLLRFPYRS